MNVSFKKMFAGVSAVAATVALMGSAVAAYSDVPAGAWYGEAVKSFTDAGYLDGTQPKFRGGDTANRAEFIKLLVELNGGILSTPPAVPSFDDVAPGAWYYGYMEEAGKEAWVKGDGNCYGSHPCYARPGASINRAEAAALIVRAFGLTATGDAPQFVDNPSGQWYTSAIQTAADACVLQGNDGRVRPSDMMNRAEMVTMLYRVDQNLSYGQDCGGSTSASPMIKSAVATSATTVEVEFTVDVDATVSMDKSNYTVTNKNGSKVTVSSVSKVSSSVVELTLDSGLSAGDKYTVSVEDMKSSDGDMFSDSADFSGFTSVPKGNGTLEVSLAANNPSGDTIPRGAVGVTLASIDMTASCDDSVSLQQLTVLHEGFGDEQDIDGLYASVDGARVSRKRTIDSQNQTSDLRFASQLNIPACGTVTVDIMADFNSTAVVSGEHNVTVELPTDVDSNAKAVTGNFPLRGATFKVAAVTSGKITVSYRTVTPDKVEVGDKAMVVGRFELNTNSVEDQTIYSMTLEQNGSAGDGDITNIKIRRSDGTVLTNAAASTVGDFVTLVFDPPFTVLQGDKITMEVVADVSGGASNTVVMHFEESSDLFAVGSLYGYGVNGQLYGSQVTIPTDSATTVTIDAGQFTVEVDGPVQQKYTRDDNNAVLANIVFTTGGESVDLKKLFVAIQGQTSTGAGLGVGNDVSTVLENVQLRNKTTGQTISAVRQTSNTTDRDSTATQTYQVYRFDDFVVKGKETWELRVDFINNGSTSHPKNGDKFKAIVCGEPQSILGTDNSLSSNPDGCNFGLTGINSLASKNYQMEVEGLSTGDSVGDVRPRGNIAGNFHRISTPQLNVAVKGSVATDTAVKNSKDVNLFRFEARAGEAQDILFTKAVFKATSGSLFNGQNYSLWVDTDGDGKVDTAIEKGKSAQSSKISFDSLTGGGYVIPAEQATTFEVHADIASSLVNGDLKIGFDSGSTGFIEAEQVDNGSSLSGYTINGSTSCAVVCSTSADFIVTTSNATVTDYILVSQGDLFVSKDTTPARAHQLLGGTLGDAVLRILMRAQNEDVDVTNLQVTSSGSTTSSVDRLELYKEGSATAFATATTSGCGSDQVLTVNPGAGNATVQTFCANMQSHQLVIPDGQRIAVLVRPRMKTDDAGAQSSTSPLAFFITKTAVSNSTTGSGAVRARGLQSSNDLSANGGDTSADGEIFIGTDSATTNSNIVGNNNNVVLSKLASIVNAGPADGTAVPSGAGKQIGAFRFTTMAASNLFNGPNKWTLSGVIFNITATNVDFDSSAFKIYNTKDTSSRVACTTVGATGSSGALVVRCDNLAVSGSAISTAINPNDSATFVLEGSITNPNTGTNQSTLQVSLQNFNTITNTTFSSATSHIQWLDQDTQIAIFNWVESDDVSVFSTTYRG